MLLVVHTGKRAALRVARLLADRLSDAGIGVRVLEPEADELGLPTAAVVPVAPGVAAEGAELVLAIGGDGTLLRAAELTRPVGAPLLGVNLGHVGFLAETEPEDLPAAVDSVVARRWVVEERMTVDVTVRVNGGRPETTWALNEATVEKAARERMLDLVIEVDGRPLSRWGCDGVVFATPTGSTAYAFSAGGPVVWPEVEALLMVPISAHALFAGPMVVSPRSVLAAEVIGVAGGQSETAGAVLWCDGRRTLELPPGSRVEVRRGSMPVLLARLPAAAGTEGRIGAPFTDRLVAKFGLPVQGWRGLGSDRAGDGHDEVSRGSLTPPEPAGRADTATADTATADTASADTASADTASADTEPTTHSAPAHTASGRKPDEEPGGHA
jgi:NAD+ kinase